MKRNWLTCLLSALMLLSFAGCGGGNANAPAAQDTPEVQKSAPATPPNLSGEWKQTNGNSEDSYQAAYIADDAVEVYWVLNEGGDEEAIALYWAGTFTPPETADEPYAWESAFSLSHNELSPFGGGKYECAFVFGQFAFVQGGQQKKLLVKENLSFGFPNGKQGLQESRYRDWASGRPVP